MAVTPEEDAGSAAPAQSTPAGGHNHNSASGPENFLNRAIKAVPAVRYALAVGGVASVVVIVFGFLSVANPKYRLDPTYLIVGVIMVFAGMFLMLVFSGAASKPGADWLKLPAILMTYFVTFAVMVFLSGVMLNYFVPGKIADMFGSKLAQAAVVPASTTIETTTPPKGDSHTTPPVVPKSIIVPPESLPNPNLAFDQFEKKYTARTLTAAQRSVLSSIQNDVTNHPSPDSKHDAYALSMRGDYRARWIADSLEHAERTAILECMKRVLADDGYQPPNRCSLVFVDGVHKGGW